MTSRHTSPQHPALLPFQRAFLDSFLRPDSASNQLLIAPPGSGKTTVAAEILRTLRRSGHIKRGLVLCPPQFVTQYSFALADDEFPAPPARVVDRYRLREWEASVRSGESPFPNSIIAVMSIHLARQPDVAANLLATQWDLLVVDEAHLLVGKRAALVQQLVASGAVTRALFMTATPQREPLASELVITDWTQEIHSAVSLAAPAIHMHWIDVSYTDAETAVLKEVQILAAKLLLGGYMELARELLERAYSSFYALEQGLLRLRNRDMRGGVVEIEGQSSLEEVNTTQSSPVSLEVFQCLTRALSTLDRIECDSKLELLLNVLRHEAGAQNKTVLVFSRFAHTVEYLVSTLVDRGVDATGITTSMPMSERMARIATAAEHGIAVLTLAAVQGCDLAQVDTYVFYEPLKSDEFGLYAARILGTGRATTIDVISFSNPDRQGTVEVMP